MVSEEASSYAPRNTIHAPTRHLLRILCPPPRRLFGRKRDRLRRERQRRGIGDLVILGQLLGYGFWWLLVRQLLGNEWSVERGPGFEGDGMSPDVQVLRAAVSPRRDRLFRRVSEARRMDGGLGMRHMGRKRRDRMRAPLQRHPRGVGATEHRDVHGQPDHGMHHNLVVVQRHEDLRPGDHRSAEGRLQLKPASLRLPGVARRPLIRPRLASG